MWTNDECLDAMRAVADKIGVSVDALQRDDYRAHHSPGTPGETAIRRRFGSWGAARCAAAGLTVPSPGYQHALTERAVLPSEAIPEGYYAHRVTTDSKGGQSIQARIQGAPGETVDPMPDGYHQGKITTLVSGAGSVVQQWVHALPPEKTRENALVELLDRWADLPGAPEPTSAPSGCDADLLAVYPMGDPHIGMLSWAPETGEDFDLRKAEALILGAFRELTAATPKAKSALIVNVGDFFHADDESATTRRSGHKLDVDSRWAKVHAAGVDIMIAAVEMCLAAHESVTVINEIGNHDSHSAIMLSAVLAAHWRNEPRVTIDRSPANRHYYQHGRCLVGVTHGDTVRLEDLGEVMADERPEQWGETSHRWWVTGHVHHSQKKELRGCTVESFRTLAPRDAWHARHGYRAGRDMHRVVLHRGGWEVCRSIAAAEALKARYLGD